MYAVFFVKNVPDTSSVNNQTDPSTPDSVLVFRVRQYINMSIAVTQDAPRMKRSLYTAVTDSQSALSCR